MTSLVREELRAAVRRPQFFVVVGLIVIVVFWSGFSALASSALDHWTEHFTGMFSWFTLIYPLAIALLTQPPLLDEWSNTYALSTRTRVSLGRYFASKVVAAAVLAAALFLALTLVCFLVAKLTYTDHGYGVPLAAPIETRFPFSQLWAVSPALYVVVFSLWVSLVSATVAAWCTLLTAVIANKFAALAAPLLLWLATNVVLTVLGAEELKLPPYRFDITQQPIWTELAGWVALLASTAVLWLFVRRRQYQSAGIVRS